MPVIAIGFFDGVHLGHQRILKGADTAVTFRNHPLSVLNAAKAPRLIMSFEDRVAAIRACGVRDVLALDFTPELAVLSPEDFLARYVWRGAAPADGRDNNRGCGIPSAPTIRCGANWRFGKGGAGTPEWLRAHGVAVEVATSVEYDGGIVSSTRIRDSLVRGEIAAANAMMGRCYRLAGAVVKGKGEGRKLGYPTVNVSLSPQSPTAVSHSSSSIPPSSLLSLPLGVYQVSVGSRRAIANYGFAPTFGDQAWREPVLEIHFLDPVAASVLPEELGPLVTVDFVKFIRPERKFASLAELKAQIAADIVGIA